MERAVRQVLEESEGRSRERLMAPSRLRAVQDSRQAGPRDEEPDSRPGPELALWDVQQLPPRQRAVVLLVYWGECSMRDVATVLQTTPQAASDLLRRAKQTLRTLAGGVAEPCDERLLS